MTYFIFFALGIALYAGAPWAARIGSKALFVARLRHHPLDVWRRLCDGAGVSRGYVRHRVVGAIHGRLLTAWSTAGIVGPVVVNYIREAQIAAGVPRAQVYDRTMYILAGMLFVGLIANLLVRPVNPKWHLPPDPAEAAAAADAGLNSYGIGRGGITFPAVVAWLVVCLPLAWGVWRTVVTSWSLFS